MRIQYSTVFWILEKEKNKTHDIVWPAEGALVYGENYRRSADSASEGQRRTTDWELSARLFIYSTNGVSPERSSWFPTENNSRNRGEVNTPLPYFLATRISVAFFFVPAGFAWFSDCRTLRTAAAVPAVKTLSKAKQRKEESGSQLHFFPLFPLCCCVLVLLLHRGPNSSVLATEAGQMFPPRRFRDTK